METHLEKIEGLERWQAWAGAGVEQLIQVEHGEGHVVTLSRWDVHTMLESATQTVFSSPGAGAPTIGVKAYPTGQVQRGLDEVVVRRPGNVAEWVAELRALGEGGLSRRFQVGVWIVEVTPPSLYANVVASTDQHLAETYRAAGDTYLAMLEGSAECKDHAAVIAALLQGDPLVPAPPQMARLAVAMCVSEAARNHRTWGVNLMLLDMLRANAVPGGFRALLTNEMHPMSKGGTFQQGKVGMKGGRKSRETWAHETAITMVWLTRFAGVRAAMVSGGGRRWRDPVKGEAYVGTVRRHLTDVLVVRFRKLGWTWD
jgi:hypothetical protein